ncbi:hypothetical protein CS0771_28980 [Catellatospora sp. IY07-71]|uniref:hypothetical protein n=1 Tax=Catellatospora sp. IY07-71 TaxID=2728827 RepID=UPI001BB3DC62|nr:hypothetical protein [Catellatospora sp. IY07-71]BCJ73354.1 hypothetical protein CS0771_28980 [Catellatospora sp. IY07-71]
MTIARAFVAAPLLLLAYGVIRIIDGLDGVRGPGVAWTTGHLAFVLALALFVPVMWTMRRLAGAGRAATAAAAVGFAGIAALTVQFGIDLVLGFLAADKAEMSAMARSIMELPGVTPVVYTFGPMLFYVAQVWLVVQLAMRGRVKWWTPVLVLTDMILPFVNKDLIPIGAVCLLISFAPLIRAVRVSAAARPGNADPADHTGIAQPAPVA